MRTNRQYTNRSDSEPLFDVLPLSTSSPHIQQTVMRFIHLKCLRKENTKNIRRYAPSTWKKLDCVKVCASCDSQVSLIENPCLTHQLWEYCANTILLILYAFVLVCVFRLNIYRISRRFWYFAMRIVNELIGSSRSIFTSELMQFAMMLATANNIQTPDPSAQPKVKHRKKKEVSFQRIMGWVVINARLCCYIVIVIICFHRKPMLICI